MDKIKLENGVLRGLTLKELADEMNCSATTIAYWLKKYGLKTKARFRDGSWMIKHHQKRFEDLDVNWALVQEYYDKGNGEKVTSKNFGFGRYVLLRAFKEGKLKRRTKEENNLLRSQTIKKKKYKHSPETKKLLSEKRKAYLTRKGKSAWKDTNKRFSVPCELWKKFLNENGIVFAEEFMPLLHKKRFFSIDIAFPDKMIGIEINGGQHYDTNGNLKPYYEERHRLIEAEGWTLYEIPYHTAFNKGNMALTIDSIMKSTDKVIFDYTKFFAARKAKLEAKSKTLKLGSLTKEKRLSYKERFPIELLRDKLAQGLNAKEIAAFLGVSYKSLHQYIRKLGLSTRKLRKPTRSEIDPNWRHNPRPNQRKFTRPSREELEKMVWSKPMTQLVKELGVGGDNTIRRWCKSYGIVCPTRGYWQRINAGWLKELALNPRKRADTGCAT